MVGLLSFFRMIIINNIKKLINIANTGIVLLQSIRLISSVQFVNKYAKKNERTPINTRVK